MNPRAQGSPVSRTGIGEVALVVLCVAAVVGSTVIPYAIASRAAGPARVFAGFIWGVDDGNVYLSWVRQAAEGRVLLRNQYTTKDQSPHFLNVFLLALGRISRWTGLPPLTVFMGSRLLAGACCLLSFYAFMAGLTRNRTVRWLGLILAGISSGLGWLVVVTGKGGELFPGVTLLPMDVADGWQAQPEAIVFASILLNPLFAFSLGLVALTAACALRMASPRGWTPAVGAGLILLLLGNVHGYDIFALHATLFVWLACSAATGRIGWGRAAGQYLVVLILSVASPAWALLAARADPAYTAKINTPTLSARPLDVAVGYGLVLVLAVWGAWRVSQAGLAGPTRRNRGALALLLGLGVAGLVAQQAGAPTAWLQTAVLVLPLVAVIVALGRHDATDAQFRALFPLLWAACGAAVIYLPVSFQRKLMEGLHLPLCALGAVALEAVVANGVRPPVLSRPLRLLVVGALLVATTPSNLLLVSDCLRHVRADNRTLLGVRLPPAYLSRAELAAMDWLAAHTGEEDIVLSSSLTGSHIPAHARCRVVVGHSAETLDFPGYLTLAERFYDPRTDHGTRQAIVRTTDPTYVWWGPQERVLQEAILGGVPADPCLRMASSLTPVYANADVTIYRCHNQERRPQ